MYQEAVMVLIGDWVLDPFMGSGTTLRVAQRLGRNAIGIDIMEEYYQMVRESLLAQPQPSLFEKREAEALLRFNSGK